MKASSSSHAAVAAMLGSTLMFSMVEVFIKRLGDQYPLHQIIAFRVILSLPVILFFLARSNQGLWFRTSVPHLHALRFFFGLTSMAAIFYAITQIPLGTAAALTSTTPLFVLLLSPLLLKEKVSALGWWGLGIGFAGVLLVSSPQSTSQIAGIASAIFGAILTTGVVVTLRLLGRTESAALSSALNTLGMCVACVLGLLIWGYKPIQSQHIWDVALLGMCGGLAQLLNTWSLKHGEAPRLTPLEFTACIWGPALGWLLWSEQLPWLSLIGIAAIVVGGILCVRIQETHR